MDNDEIKSNDEQIILSIVSLITVLISIVLLVNEKYKLVHKKGFMNSDDENTVNRFNHIAIFILFLLFLVINYKNYKDIIKIGKEDPKPYLLQIYSSILVVIATGISLYVALTAPTKEEAELENPTL